MVASVGLSLRVSLHSGFERIIFLTTIPEGTFVITFHFLGFLYSWGVIQADLLGKGLASSQLLSVVGGLQAFWNAAGCIPVRCISLTLGSVV
jgi:hypothetical protein